MKTWGIGDDSALDKDALHDLHEKLSEPIDDVPSRPLHPAYLCLSHDVFTSAIAFIDVILDPDNALMVGAGYLDHCPISLPTVPDEQKAADGSKQERVEEDSPLSEWIKLDKEQYVFRLIGDNWFLRFPNDPDKTFSNLLGLQQYARLLKNSGQPMNALQVEGLYDERFDVKFGTDERVDEETIESVQATISELQARITDARNHGGDPEWIEEQEADIQRLKEYLSKNTTDGDKARRLGSTGELTLSRSRVGINLSRTRHRIAKEMPSLADHLKNNVLSINGKMSFCYRPPTEIPWVLD